MFNKKTPTSTIAMSFEEYNALSDEERAAIHAAFNKKVRIIKRVVLAAPVALVALVVIAKSLGNSDETETSIIEA